MLIVKNKKAVVLATNRAGQITSAIAKAKVLKQKGDKALVAVGHSLRNYRVLKNMGFNVPNPIEYYYKWAGRYTPYAHQIDTAGFLAANARAYCLNGLGAGKSLSCLWAFDYLRSIGLAKRMLVVAPLSTLERTWADEVFFHFPHLECAVLHGSKEKRLRLLNTKADVLVINHDGLKVLEKELAAEKFDVVTLDEITQIARNQRSGRWKATNVVIKDATWVWALTATPIPNNPADAYGQIKLITPNRAPRSYTQFQDMVTTLVGPYRRIPKRGSTETIFNMMQPSIRYATRDCIDLPPTIYVTRHAPMTPEQEKAYRRMQTQKVFQSEEGGQKTIAQNEAIVATKLVQICSGAILQTDGSAARVESPERLNICKELIDSSEGKVIVFAPYLAAIDYIIDELRKEYGEASVAQIDGRVSKNERDQTFGDFQKADNPRIIVAQPAAMSHGLTLTAASTIIWFAPPYSNEVYEQANGRIVRPGQKRHTLIANIEGSPFERLIYKRLVERGALQGKLLEMMEAA